MGKHVQVDQLKTVNGQTIVGKGDIEISSGEVNVDNKTITLTENGELQLGKVAEGQYAREIDVRDQDFVLRNKYSKTVFGGDSIVIESDEGDYMHLSRVLFQMYNEYSSGMISPGLISLQAEGNSVELGNGEINLAKSEEGIAKGGITLSPLFLAIKNENGQVNHTFTFPSQAVNNNSTMVVSVNNQVADEKGNITIPSEEGKTDNKTISKNEDGELQLGVFNDGEYLLKDVRITIEASESQNDFTTIDSGSIAVQTTDNHGNITYAEVKSNGFLHSENLELPPYNVDFPKEFTSEDKLKVNMTFSVNDVFADEKGNIEIPSEKLSNQFLTNTEGEKILAVDGGAYGQIPGFSLKEIAGGIAKGAVVGDAGLLTDEGNSQGVLSAYIDQGYAKVITNTAKLIDEANDSVISGKQEVIAQSEYAHSEYVTSLSKGLSGEGGKLYASRLGASTTTKYGAESYLKSSYNQSGNHTESSISVRADEDLSVITAITENFIVRNALTGKEYSIMEILDPLMARNHIKLPLLQGYSSTVDYEDPTATRIGDQVYYNINIVKTNGSLEVGDVVLKIPSSHLPFRPKPIFAQSNSGTIQLELKTNGDIVVRHIVEGTGLMQVYVSGSYLINQDY